ncbi:hypothetical protein E2P64_07685 [Candidatus Bathyarchaeota archaeon]|nr:hypothetical protein E2P64_07685 [Candidatus Bathyarchaeota archaeon]
MNEEHCRILLEIVESNDRGWSPTELHNAAKTLGVSPTDARRAMEILMDSGDLHITGDLLIIRGNGISQMWP